MRSTLLTIILACGFFLLTSCATVPPEPVIEEMQDGSFRISVIYETEWSGQFLSNKLIKKAEIFCEERQQQFEKVQFTVKDDGRFNYAKSEVIFKCIKDK